MSTIHAKTNLYIIFLLVNRRRWGLGLGRVDVGVAPCTQSKWRSRSTGPIILPRGTSFETRQWTSPLTPLCPHQRGTDRRLGPSRRHSASRGTSSIPMPSPASRVSYRARCQKESLDPAPRPQLVLKGTSLITSSHTSPESLLPCPWSSIPLILGDQRGKSRTCVLFQFSIGKIISRILTVLVTHHWEWFAQGGECKYQIKQPGPSFLKYI